MELMANKVVISVFTDEDLRKKLQAMADKESRSLSQMCAVLLAEAVRIKEKKGND
jgi:predicted transcriptional regulator